MNIGSYFKQGWRILRENPVLSGIAILGTALSICMIMVMVISFRLQNASISPESNRHRTLYVRWMSAENKKNEGSNNGCMSYGFGQRAFKSLQTPEAVGLAVPFSRAAMISTPGVNVQITGDVKPTDDGYWKVFDYTFVAGKPYTSEDVKAGLPRAVITDDIARQLFSTAEVVGNTILVDYTEYVVSGVVRAVSPLFEFAYSQIWVTVTSTVQETTTGMDDIPGSLSAYILAHSPSDFDRIREEVEQKRLRINAGNRSYDAVYRGQPDVHFISRIRNFANQFVNANSYITTKILSLLIFLFVPALNLSGITISRMRKRLAELGVRRAFGASRGHIVSQVFWESLVQTLFGGVIGLFLSCVAVYVLKDLLFSSFMTRMSSASIEIDPLALMSLWIFLVAFLFCLLLNLCSALLPALFLARRPIVDSLQER